MATPVKFPSSTMNFALPLLSIGQAQKEFFINQALSIVDALLQGAIDGSSATPPAEPNVGGCYRVLANADADWAGRDDQIALWIGGSWTFVDPKPGMKLHDRGAATTLFFDGEWQTPGAATLPAGGDTIDAEARSAIVQLFDALRKVGILPDSV